MKIFVSNPNSFIGKNLIENLKNIKTGKNRTRPDISIDELCDESTANVVFILPGTDLDDLLQRVNRDARIIFISTLLGSKEDDAVFAPSSNALVYRLPEVVGKWQNPEDSVVAYLCNAVANDEQYEVGNRNEMINILFIDDFLDEMYNALEGHPHKCEFPKAGGSSSDPTSDYDGKTPVANEEGKYCYSPKAMIVSIGSIIDNLIAFNHLNSTSIVPEIPQGKLPYHLYSMYLSFLPERKMSYPLNMNMDNRGIFTELVKTPNNGQVSINIARPGNIRGQHWHNNKWEIFMVVSGHGLIQQRKIGSDKVHNFEVHGEDMRAVILLPGYTHNIINLEKDRDLVTVMFANEQFDSTHPDTFFEIVDEKYAV